MLLYVSSNLTIPTIALVPGQDTTREFELAIYQSAARTGNRYLHSP